MHVALDFIGRNSAYSVTLMRRDNSQLILIQTKNYSVVFREINEDYSRLRGSSDAKAHQGAEDEDPPINGCKCTHQAIEHSPQHTHLETLCVHTVKT